VAGLGLESGTGGRGAGDGPAGETSGWSGHWRGVSVARLVLEERGEGGGGGDPKTVEGVLVIIRAGLIADLHQGYVPIACIRKDTGALHSRGT
jgi:hypothetical protein